MLYYFGGKFNPWTRAHFNILDSLLQQIEFDKSWSCENDQILIGITTLPKDTEIKGHMLCSSEEYREELIRPSINHFYKKYSFLKREKLNISIVYQNNPSTYEFLQAYCITHSIVDWEHGTTLVLGEDEFLDLTNSTSDKIGTNKPKWKHADELSKFSVFVVKRDSVGDKTSSSKVREIFHRNPYASYDDVKEYISKPVFDLIKSWHHYWQYGQEDEYRREENKAIKNYDITKFPRPSATVDMVIIKSANKVATEDEKCSPDEVLLIRRKNFPYKGFWALPGGFLDINEDESLEEAATRELMEETDISFNFKPIDQFRTYSNIGTDPRGRIVDTVYVAKDLNWWPKAGDDACEFGWFKMTELPRMAFNHRQIIDDLLRAKYEH